MKVQIHKALVEAGIADKIEEKSTEVTDNAQIVLNRRYLAKDENNKNIEDVNGMWRRVAYNLSEADLLYVQSSLTNAEAIKDRQRTEERFYNLMSRLEFLPNSPTLMNAGRRLQQLSACFVLPVEDSIDSIFTMVKNTATIHKSGGGTGFSFSRLRPEGDVVGSTGGVASGPVSFIKAFDAATDVVKQGGTRRGANMGILSVYHPDIIKFITAKLDGTQLQNFNISVAVDAAFMDKVYNKEPYEQINPKTGEVVGIMRADEVFNLIVEAAWTIGDPGLVFLDRLNADNPNPQLGKIESTNPCGEQPLLPFESCNLGSINLARMVVYTSTAIFVDWARLEYVTKEAVHMLDDVIDMNKYPLPEIDAMSKSTRRIGIGVMGFADLLVQLGIRYDSQDALELAEDLMYKIQSWSHEASQYLAEERGSFPVWETSVYTVPMRNSAPVTIAPTGTISIIAGASSGIEPLFALSYVRNVMDQTMLIEVNPYFEAVARYEGFYSEELMAKIAQIGSIEGIEEIPEWVKEVFRTSHDISPEWHVKIQAAFQKYTDNSVSKTINFAHDATIEDVYDAYMLAWETGCKGITIYRDGTRLDQVLSTNNGHSKVQIPLKTQERPRKTVGITEKVKTGHGNMYVTLNFDQNKPLEHLERLEDVILLN
jgi:ribonucleoside-diphosphate reductase alpha chain